MKINKELFNKFGYKSATYTFDASSTIFKFGADKDNSKLQNLYIHFNDDSIIKIRTYHNDEDIEGFITDLNLFDIVKYKGWKLDRIMVFRVGNKLPYLSVGITFEKGDIKESVIINFNYSYSNNFIDGIYEESDIVIEEILK